MKQMELKELINVRTGKLDANASSENGKYPFFTCSKETLKIDTYSYDCECVLLAGNGDLNVKYYNGKFDAYQRTYILECKNEIISTKYLYYFMKKYLKILRNQSIGGVIKYIKLANITEAIIPIYNKEEQEEIVNNLSKVEQILNIKNEQMEELQKFIKSQFVEMFGNIYFNDRKWNKNKWGDVLIIKNGKNQKKVESFNGKYPIYGSGGIIGFANDYICNENSIIIGRKGSINKPILVKTKFWNVDTAFGLEPIKEKIKADYLYYFCCFYNFEKHNKAVTIPSLTKKDLLNIVIPVPPITLQNQFAEIVKQIDKQKFESMIQLKMMEKIYNIINDRRRYV